ncbi:hypothetical protein H6G54_02685 [Anabaena cylindrica FACHB-243]|uniref:Uncharacterized protein n=1 Tax=Anabaena cylindrica (strain ATCC 27899 / PCC 7122) TaxID=272123 RepID=K9ZSF7_ANACC|nr:MULTISPECIES: hypothetical protein [Anabaena]AFZ61295.1 hypothetical protein Anacy_6017 [Anabaena cylindrica PCC 7122]MBD2416633.1 hypothetical protein [Anabaena cylindrica FACHB-243]MBY5284498.1 hypothetical protein [Anabaena sp. CCAP 1446/1C]MBY5306754.1 hypothetical protein [Anabaena sp. CCAP 1446/1C]MCM2410085.1 hypothetical protein [Anabaena sp. CCAP 1446/1C]
MKIVIKQDHEVWNAYAEKAVIKNSETSEETPVKRVGYILPTNGDNEIIAAASGRDCWKVDPK